MNRERLLDLATVGVLLAAVLVGLSSAWERFVRPTLEKRPVRVDEWERVSRSGHLIGDSTAPVLIVEFGDYECPGCRLFEQRLTAFKAAYPGAVAVRYRHWPLEYHEAAYPAARAAECAAHQDRFAAFHERLMGESGWVEAQTAEAEFIRLAHDVGVPDSTRFRECVTETEPVPRIEADIATARDLGGRGTPMLVINGWLMREMPDSSTLAAILDRASSEAGLISRPLVGQQGSTEASSGLGELPVWKLSTSPTLTLGDVDDPPEQAFGYLTGAVQMTNGAIAVVDASAAEVKLFGSDGSYLQTLGGEGDGPGELQGPRLLYASRYDSLVLAEVDRRISVVRADGTIYPAGSIPNPRDFLRAVAPGGTIVYQRFFNMGTRVPRSGPRITDIELGLVDPQSQERNVVGRYRYYTTYVDVDGGRQKTYTMLLRSGLSVAPTALGIQFVVGNQGTVRAFDTNAKVWDSISLPLPHRAVGSDDIARAIETEIASRPAEDAESRARRREVLERIPYPEHLPFVERMVPDQSGGTWIQLSPEYLQDGEPNWIVADAEGRHLAEVRVPDELDVFQIGPDYVMGTSRGEFGTYRVHRYRLTRRPEGLQPGSD